MPKKQREVTSEDVRRERRQVAAREKITPAAKRTTSSDAGATPGRRRSSGKR